MFSVDDTTAAAIQTAFDDSGELAAVVELQSPLSNAGPP
jgi:hypothetical protein